MKTTNHNTQSSSLTSASRTSRIGFTLALTASLLCGVAVSTSAQNSGVAKIAAERAFTIAPNVQTPIVVKTRPDAECTLHAEGASDSARTMKLYANADGYVRVHVSAKQESEQDLRMQLDCASAGKVTTYPIRLRAASSPTSDMPAPQSSMPTPKGSHVLPALTEEEAQQLSDQEVISRGYLPRPDAATAPDNYASWLEMVSRPVTLLAPHSVSRSDIGRSGNVEAGAYSSANWSGYEAHHKKRSYMGVQGEWNVPIIIVGESGNVTYSAFWVGLDGDGTKDLVQAGTEQDYVDEPPFVFASYSAWTELLPNQPTEQLVSLSPNAGDDFFVSVWIGKSDGTVNQNGGYGWFYLYDKSQGQAVEIATALSGTYFNGSEAEWIMERPSVGGSLSDLSAYLFAPMVNAYALPTVGAWKAYGKVQNRQISMWDGKDELSIVTPGGKGVMYFNWLAFH
jgi:Peptidase A4 family